MSYISTVLADSPKAFWELQDAPGTLPVDSSGHGLNCSAAGPNITQQAAVGPAGGDWAVYFHGSQYSLSALTSTVVNNFTMEFWIKLNTAIASNTTPLFFNGNGGANGWGVAADTNGTFKGWAGGVAFQPNDTLGALSSSAWKHVVVKRDAGVWAYYLNNVKQSAVGTTTPNVPAGGPGQLGGSGNYYMAYFAVYETALSDAQVSAHYNAMIVDTTPPVLNDLRCKSITLDYDSPLDSSSVPAASDFAITDSGVAQTITAVAISGSTVVLTLSPGIASGETVNLSYTPGTNPIRDAAHNNAAAFSNQAVVAATTVFSGGSGGLVIF